VLSDPVISKKLHGNLYEGYWFPMLCGSEYWAFEKRTCPEKW